MCDSPRRLSPNSHPNAGEGLWGSEAEVPSFLYAMPMEGGRRVFLEETCLVAKPALPFAVLKRRLQRRLAASGIKVAPICHCLQLVVALLLLISDQTAQRSIAGDLANQHSGLRTHHPPPTRVGQMQHVLIAHGKRR